MFFFHIFVILIILSTTLSPSKMEAVRWPKLVLFGDSLTQNSFCDGGWATYVTDICKRRCDVLNRGFSGYTAAINKLLLPTLLKNDMTPSDAIAAVVILLGSNDSVLPGTDARATTLEKYSSDLTDIIEQFINNGLQASQIVLMTPPPVEETKWYNERLARGIPGEMNLSNERVGMFAKQCLSVGVQLGIDVVDLNTEMQKEQDWARFLEDGLHFSREGNEFVARQLIPVLQSKLDSLKTIFPDWKDIDFENPKTTLEKYIELNIK